MYGFRNTDNDIELLEEYPVIVIVHDEIIELVTRLIN